MSVNNQKIPADSIGFDAPTTSVSKAAQASTQMSSEPTDDKSSTKKTSPRVLAERNWQVYLDIAKKMSESEHMAMTALLHATSHPDGTFKLSELGLAAVNAYLDEGATIDVVGSSLELGKYRIKRAQRFFDKKYISDAKKDWMQDILLEVAFDVAYIDERFKALQANAVESPSKKSNTHPKQR